MKASINQSLSFRFLIVIIAVVAALAAMPMMAFADEVVADTSGGASATSEKIENLTFVGADPCTGEGQLFVATMHRITTPKGYRVVLTNASLADGTHVVYNYGAVSANTFMLTVHWDGHRYFVHYRFDDFGNLLQYQQIDNCDL